MAMPGTLLLAVALTAAASVVVVVVVDGQLSPTFYDAACPALPSIVRRGMAQAVQKEARMGASVLRLFFHDCFVNVRFDSIRSATSARRSWAR
jgi:peroxidase